MSYTYYRAKYTEFKGIYEIRNYFDDTLYKTELSSTIPNDPTITPDINGDYIGVYYVEEDRFIADEWYDITTGWIWVTELTWELNMARSL